MLLHTQTRRSVLEGRIWGLDLVRAVAALLVAMHHFTKHWPTTWTTTDAGWIGVEIFFVISGMMIAQSAMEKAPIDFAISRVTRLYPASWACTLISIVTIAALPQALAAARIDFWLSRRAIVQSLLLLPNRFVLSPYWTMPIEIIFYLIIFACMVARIGSLEQIGKALIIWSGIYTVLSASNIFLGVGPNIGFNEGSFRNLLLAKHGVFFGFGMLCSLRSTWEGDRRWLALGLAVGLLEIACHAHESGTYYSHPADTVRIGVVATLWFGLALASMFAAVKFGRLIELGPTASRVIRTLGLASFPFYLIHESVGGLGFAAGMAAGLPTSWNSVAASGATLAVSVVIVRSVEPRLKKLLRAGIERHFVDRFMRVAAFARLFKPAAI